MVMHSLAKPGDLILVDANKHYTTVVAAERVGLNIIEVPNSEHPEFIVDVNEYETLIKKYTPKLILLTYPDGNYGNLPDAKRLREIAQKYNIPYILNGAYAVGRMPISMDEIGADFIIGSGHKSMASAGPAGVLGMKKKWEETVLRKSSKYSKQLGEKPHRHDLLHFDAPALYEISKRVRERGFFLYKELKERGIWGPQPGLARSFKLSTFAADKQQLGFVIDSFKVILNKYS